MTEGRDYHNEIRAERDALRARLEARQTELLEANNRLLARAREAERNLSMRDKWLVANGHWEAFVKSLP
jgi:dephospho-CoA kinase